MLALLAVLMPAGALAASCTDSWAKAENGSWSTASDWSSGKVPGSGDEVCITASSASPYTVTLTGGVSVKTLKLGDASGAKQTLLVGGPLSSATLSVSTSGEIETTGVLDLESGSGFSATLNGGATIGSRGEVISSASASGVNFLETPLANATGGTVEVKSGELRQDDNTTTTNEGSFKVLSGAIFHPSTGSDLFVNKGSLANGGTLVLTGSASWTQEAGSAEQSGSPVVMYSGTLTDVSGAGSFDLIDSPTLTGTIPAGQTVTADAIPGHNAVIEIPATVTNEGTLALVSPTSGGESELHASLAAGKVVNDGLITAQSESSVNFLEVPLTSSPRRNSGSQERRMAPEQQHDDHQRRLVQGAWWRDVRRHHGR